MKGVILTAERLLSIAVIGLSALLILGLMGVVFRDFLRNFRESESEFRAQMIKNLIQGWLMGSSEEDRSVTLKKLKALGPPDAIEPLFFECYETSAPNEKPKLRELFKGMGFSRHLYLILKKSSDPYEREEAILKISRLASLDYLPVLLEIFHDPNEEMRVKERCVEALSHSVEEIFKDRHSDEDLALLLSLSGK